MTPWDFINNPGARKGLVHIQVIDGKTNGIFFFFLNLRLVHPSVNIRLSLPAPPDSCIPQNNGFIVDIAWMGFFNCIMITAALVTMEMTRYYIFMRGRERRGWWERVQFDHVTVYLTHSTGKKWPQIRLMCCVIVPLRRRNVCVCGWVCPFTHHLEYRRTAFKRQEPKNTRFRWKTSISVLWNNTQATLPSSMCVCAREHDHIYMHLRVFCACLCVYLDWISAEGIFDLEQEDVCYQNAKQRF